MNQRLLQILNRCSTFCCQCQNPRPLSPVNTQWSNVNRARDVRRVPGYFNIFPRQREVFFMSIISSRWAASHLTCACNNFISRPRLMNLTIIFSNSNFESLILLLLSITVEYYGQGQIDHSHSEDIFLLGFGYHIHCDEEKSLKPQVLFTTELAMSGQITKLCEKFILSSPSSFSI